MMAEPIERKTQNRPFIFPGKEVTVEQSAFPASRKDASECSGVNMYNNIINSLQVCLTVTLLFSFQLIYLSID